MQFLALAAGMYVAVTTNVESAFLNSRSKQCDRHNRLHRRSTEEKRVANALIREELGVTLQYPTYIEGLRAIAAGDLRPFNASL